jgi:hypothetical protein
MGVLRVVVETTAKQKTATKNKALTHEESHRRTMQMIEVSALESLSEDEGGI